MPTPARQQRRRRVGLPEIEIRDTLHEKAALRADDAHRRNQHGEQEENTAHAERHCISSAEAMGSVARRTSIADRTARARSKRAEWLPQHRDVLVELELECFVVHVARHVDDGRRRILREISLHELRSAQLRHQYIGEQYVDALVAPATDSASTPVRTASTV